MDFDVLGRSVSGLDRKNENFLRGKWSDALQYVAVPCGMLLGSGHLGNQRRNLWCFPLCTRVRALEMFHRDVETGADGRIGASSASRGHFPSMLDLRGW